MHKNTTFIMSTHSDGRLTHNKRQIHQVNPWHVWRTTDALKERKKKKKRQDWWRLYLECKRAWFASRLPHSPPDSVPLFCTLTLRSRAWSRLHADRSPVPRPFVIPRYLPPLRREHSLLRSSPLADCASSSLASPPPTCSRCYRLLCVCNFRLN